MEPILHPRVNDLPNKICKKGSFVYLCTSDGVDKITNDAYSHNVTHKCNSQVIIDFT